MASQPACKQNEDPRMPKERKEVSSMIAQIAAAKRRYAALSIAGGGIKIIGIGAEIAERARNGSGREKKI
jgi:hypothetical protein